MEENKTCPKAETAEVVDIQFRPGQKIYYFDPNGIACKQGDHVIIDTARGPEYGICASGNHHIPMKDVVAPLRCVLRIATAHDEKVVEENRAKERRAYELCTQKIREQQLDMQLVSAECAFDGSKILFFFTADERVDFRDLVKQLASSFHTRIELRQIGVRDKAKMVGGLGICGRPFCCASFLDDFQPVSIKMAKTQNLSLNPTKISGTCGRLMCCLKYEQDAYEDLIRNSPKAESFVDTVDGRGTVVEVDLLRQRVKVKMEDSPETITWYANADIAVLRNGKAKKTDAPIPADLAPLSGGGKRKARENRQDNGSRMFLDPIKFRYSEETIAEEQTVSEVVPEQPAENEGQKRNNRRRNRKPRGEKPEAPVADEEPKTEAKGKKPQPEKKPEQKKPRPEKKPAPQQAQAPKPEGQKAEGQPKPEGEAKKPRRPYYRRRKPKAQ